MSISKNIFLFILLILVAFVLLAIAKAVPVWQGIAPLTGGHTVLDEVEETGKLPLKLPEGFSISVFAEGLGDPRALVHSPSGGLLVSAPSRGIVYLVADKDGNGTAEHIIPIAEGLHRPHGVTTRCVPSALESEFECFVYIAEEGGVSEYKYDTESEKAINRKSLLPLPESGGHFTRSLLFMPYPNDATLLVSVGSSCNVCHEDDERRASILAYDVDTGVSKLFAKGLRNTVFMTIHPVTGDIWGTDMGRDWLGDSLPPDEINILEEDGNYGWPYCYGKNELDPFSKDIPAGMSCSGFYEGSHIDIPAHSAPLGIAFFGEEGWPQEYWFNALVAYHGSWNSSVPTGYKVVRYELDEKGTYKGEEDFITGWLPEAGDALGRPVDVLIESGGTMYISDDKAGVIYRVKYEGET